MAELGDEGGLDVSEPEQAESVKKWWKLMSKVKKRREG